MPFTPIHMGPGILIKALMQSSFSLMIFGWTQILMDIQPLVLLLTGKGHLHGFTHTYGGALLIAAISALTGKYLSEMGLRLLGVFKSNHQRLTWFVTIISAVIGSTSHVLLDSVMHSDVEPFFPFSSANPFHHIISVSLLPKLCLYSGLAGAALFYVAAFRAKHITAKNEREQKP